MSLFFDATEHALGSFGRFGKAWKGKGQRRRRQDWPSDSSVGQQGGPVGNMAILLANW